MHHIIPFFNFFFFVLYIERCTLRMDFLQLWLSVSCTLCSCTDVQGCQDSKLQAERISELQERKQSLQSLLISRLGELRQVCLLEAVRWFIKFWNSILLLDSRYKVFSKRNKHKMLASQVNEICIELIH